MELNKYINSTLQSNVNGKSYWDINAPKYQVFFSAQKTSIGKSNHSQLAQFDFNNNHLCIDIGHAPVSITISESIGTGVKIFLLHDDGVGNKAQELKGPKTPLAILT